MSTSARAAHSSSCSTAAARNVSHAANKTFWPVSARSRRANFPFVVVLPMPFAPKTRMTVGPAAALVRDEAPPFIKASAMRPLRIAVTSCSV